MWKACDMPNLQPHKNTAKSESQHGLKGLEIVCGLINVSPHCTTSREIIRGVSYQLVTVRLPSVSVGRMTILASNHSIVLDSSAVDNLCKCTVIVLAFCDDVILCL